MDTREKLTAVIERLDRAIEVENETRRNDGGFGLAKATIRILGQSGLLLHPDKHLVRLSLVATADVDALIEAEDWVLREFRSLLAENGFEYDQDSEKIWIPKGSTFTRIFFSPRLECEALDPLYSLVSKAIKAKEKNRILMRDALTVYGEDLRRMIEGFGGSCAYFEGKNS